MDFEMSNRGSELRVVQPVRRAVELSPELRELLHMLEAIEEAPKPASPATAKKA